MTLRKLIYHPSGRAGEYADKGYAANLFKGCTHGCKYCYVPAFTHQKKEIFHASVSPAPDVLERLKADMKRVGVLKEPIFLCFTCDPYGADAPTEITREAIKIIMEAGNTVNILTKGGRRACGDFDLLSQNPGNKLGVGGYLAFVKKRNAFLIMSSRECSVRWEGEDESVYSAVFTADATQEAMGKPLSILKEADVLQAGFNLIDKGSKITGGRAICTFNNSIQFTLDIPPQETKSNFVLFHNPQVIADAFE